MESIQDTPLKRRKIAKDDIFKAEGYNSEEDSGDNLFEGYETVDTLPAFHCRAGSVTQPESYVTQPTQPLQRPATPQNSSRSIVQVAGSSPLQQTKDNRSSAFGKHTGGALASTMAPPGTTFKLPYGVSTSPAPSKSSKPIEIDLSDDDDQPLYCGGSSDEDTQTTSKADIRPSSFAPTDTLERLGGLDRFKRVTANSIYRPSKSSMINSSDIMANAYGGVRRDRPPQPIPQPAPIVASTVRDRDLASIEDHQTRKKIERLQEVLPQCSVNICLNALVKRKGVYEDAMDLLASQEELSSLPVDLTGPDDELPKDRKSVPQLSQPPLRRPMAKQQVKASNLKIQEKWTASPKLHKASQVSSPPVIDLPKAHRRRLVQGSKREDSPDPATVHVFFPESSPRADRSASGQSDSGFISDYQEIGLDDEILRFFNSCSARDLVDIAAVGLETATKLLAQRPFTSLQRVRQVTEDSGKKKISRKPIGDKIVEKCLEMWSGYQAVDRLVQKCEELGDSVCKDMDKWGVNIFGSSKEGELELIDLDTASNITRDSGIGTPMSHEVSDDDDHKKGTISSLPPTKRGLYPQPAIMAEGIVLKDYQVVGINWLALLFDKRLSCILADDMGLGKTCQVVAFFALLLETKSVSGPHLVIVPASTLENWLREFRQFCPRLNVMPYYAAEKERAEIREQIFESLDSINVIVTTYTVAKAPVDNKFLRQVKPICVVYDEGHTLKNSKSAGYGLYMKIPSDFRLLLTGTPLQNNLRELASLLGFILPSLFKEHSESLEAIFSHKAKTTDSTESHTALLSEERIKRAKTMMTPFVLRRKKHQVLKYLPRKYRSVQYCDIFDSQKAIYEEEKARALNVINRRKAGVRTGNETTNVMMDLRKASIHPLLFRRHYDKHKLVRMAEACLKEDEFQASNVNLVYEDMEVMTDMELHQFCERYPHTMSSFRLEHEEWMDSGKVKTLSELLQKYKRNGDRILVFSQFVMVLNILEAVMETLDMRFFRLDGTTRIDERQDMIDQFYREPDITVFLLSTGAGGAGINLACANKVIIFDSSFNPQADVQAENRAHRVGQTREVEVVRLITKGTIEEQIHALGETKLALDDRVAGIAENEAKVEKQGVNIVAEMMLGDLRQSHRDDNAAIAPGQ